MITTTHPDQDASPPRVEVITSVQRGVPFETAIGAVVRLQPMVQE